MRGIVLAVVLCACRGGFDDLPPPAPPPDPSAPDVVANITPDLVLWYELDDVGANKQVLDISGNELHGNCRTTCPTVVDGYVEHALDFSSITIIEVPKLDALKLGAFTVAAWIWLPANSPLQCPIRSTTSAWRVCASASELRFVTGAHTLQATTPIPTATWVHVAVSWDGTTKALYVDGKLAGTTTAAGTALPEQVWIGAFLGHVDDFRVYRNALAQTEIDAIYTELW